MNALLPFLAAQWRRVYSKVKASAVAAGVVGVLLNLPQWVSDHAGLFPGLPGWASAVIAAVGSSAVVSVAAWLKKESVQPTPVKLVPTTVVTQPATATAPPTMTVTLAPAIPDPSAPDASTAVPNPPPSPEPPAPTI